MAVQMYYRGVPYNAIAEYKEGTRVMGSCVKGECYYYKTTDYYIDTVPEQYWNEWIPIGVPLGILEIKAFSPCIV